ncbi:hypothetical protein [Helicobacter cinaedi]|uniref:hypothetical protein n=1 Tax=Helicobacter cinaedi TaxID=213 RepID=UPI0015F06D8A|nr:hypothetical protein [Helicobacter cinaedi]
METAESRIRVVFLVLSREFDSCVSSFCKCGFCRFGLVLRTSVALPLHISQ